MGDPLKIVSSNGFSVRSGNRRYFAEFMFKRQFFSQISLLSNGDGKILHEETTLLKFLLKSLQHVGERR